MNWFLDSVDVAEGEARVRPGKKKNQIARGQNTILKSLRLRTSLNWSSSKMRKKVLSLDIGLDSNFLYS